MKRKSWLTIAFATILAVLAFAVAGCAPQNTPSGPDNGGDNPPPAPAASVEISNTAANLDLFETVTLTATAKNTDAAVVWSSSNPDVASVDGGTVRALGVGTSEIKATAGEASAVCLVTVSDSGYAPVLTYAFDTEKGIAVNKDAQYPLSVSVKWNHSDVTDVATFKWTSADENIATVSPDNAAEATVTGVEYGKTKVSLVWSVRGTEKTLELDVAVRNTDVVFEVEGENVTPDECAFSGRVALLEANEGVDVAEIPLDVKVYYKGEIKNDAQITYSVENPLIAAITPEGVITGLKAGNTVIKGTFDHSEFKVEVEVYRPDYALNMQEGETLFIETAVDTEVDTTDLGFLTADDSAIESAELGGKPITVTVDSNGAKKFVIDSSSLTELKGNEGETELVIVTEKVRYGIECMLVTKIITTEEEYNNRATYANGYIEERTDNEIGGYFVLGADLDFSETAMKADGHTFVGVFDGMGHVIRHATSESNITAGLFRVLNGDSVVRNITFVDAVVNSTAGALLVNEFNGGTVENIVVYGSFGESAKGSNWVPSSLLVSRMGSMASVIKNCLVVCTGHASSVDFGGLILGGNANNDLTNFSNNIAVNLTWGGSDDDIIMPAIGIGQAAGSDKENPNPGRKVALDPETGRPVSDLETTLTFCGWAQYLEWAKTNSAAAFAGDGWKLVNGVPVATAFYEGNTLKAEYAGLNESALTGVSATDTEVSTATERTFTVSGVYSLLSVEADKDYVLDGNTVVFPADKAAGDSFAVTVKNLLTDAETTCTVTLVGNQSFTESTPYSSDIYHSMSENGGSGTLDFMFGNDAKNGIANYDVITLTMNGADISDGVTYANGKLSVPTENVKLAFGNKTFVAKFITGTAAAPVSTVTVEFTSELISMVIKDAADFKNFMTFATEVGKQYILDVKGLTEAAYTSGKYTDYSNGLFKLGKNIDFTQETYGGSVFKLDTLRQSDDKTNAVGHGFHGTFDGCGYAVIGFKRTASNYSIFGGIGKGTGDNNGVVKNFALLDAVSEEAKGALIADVLGGTVQDVYVALDMNAAATGLDNYAHGESSVIASKVIAESIINRIFIEYKSRMGETAKGGALYQDNKWATVNGLYVVGATGDYAIANNIIVADNHSNMDSAATLADFRAKETTFDASWNSMWNIVDHAPVFKLTQPVA